MSGPQLVIMAAGIGSRYGGLKQLDSFGPSGEKVIDYALFDAISAGFEKIIFVIRKDIEDVFREKIGSVIEKKTEVVYTFQELDNLPEGYRCPPQRSKPWGTGHAVLSAKKAVSGPFAVINADDFYGKQSFTVLANYLKEMKDDAHIANACMVGFILENTLSEHGYVSRGVCAADAEGMLSSVVERTKIQRMDGGVKYADENDGWVDIDASSIVSMNMWGFTPSFMDELEQRFAGFLDKNIQVPKAEYFVPSVINDLIAEKKMQVKVLHSDSKWFGVTYEQDKAAVKSAIANLVERGEYPQSLWGA